MPKQQMIGLLMPLFFLGIFYFLAVVPQRKKEKKLKEMRNTLAVGNEVVTIGGMIGRIIKVAEDQVVVELGADKTRIPFERWAIATVKNPIELKKKKIKKKTRKKIKKKKIKNK